MEGNYKKNKDDTKEAKKEGETKADEEDAKGEKKRRGRPRKVAKTESKEAASMLKFLEKKEAAGFEVGFGGRRRLEHSPVTGRNKVEPLRSADKEDPCTTNGGSKEKQGENTTPGAASVVTAEEEDAGESRTETEEDREENIRKVREVGNERERVYGTERTDEWRARMEVNLRELKECVEYMCSEKSDMQGEIERLKKRLKDVSKEVEETRREIYDVRKETEAVRQENVRLGEMLKEASGGKLGTVERSENEIVSEGEGSGSGYVSEVNGDESDKENERLEEKEKGGNQAESAEEARVGVFSAEERVIEREYLKCVPERMNEREYEWELKERRRRKNNIVIRGYRGEGAGKTHEISKVIESKLGIKIDIRRSRAAREGIILELGSVKNKLEIMKRKGGLKETGWWIDDDYTEREKRAQEWLRKIEEEETRNGLNVKVGYMKIRVDGNWYVWDEEKGQIRDMTFRKEGERDE